MDMVSELAKNNNDHDNTDGISSKDKQFIAFWGENFVSCIDGQANMQVVPFDFFSNDIGYDDYDRNAMNEIDVGECYKSTENRDSIYNDHSIVRIK